MTHQDWLQPGVCKHTGVETGEIERARHWPAILAGGIIHGRWPHVPAGVPALCQLGQRSHRSSHKAVQNRQAGTWTIEAASPPAAPPHFMHQ